MTDREQKKAAKEFAERWKDKGYEKGQSQSFWNDLLEHVYGVENTVDFINYEDKVHLDHTAFIDGFIKSTHVMIEQKSLGKNLRKPIKQSDGSLLTPFQQAKRYSAELPYDDRPRWIITCNFAEFLVYDMNKPNSEPEQIMLKDLPKDYYRLSFITKQKSEMLKKEERISIQAGELVGKLYDAIRIQYKEPDSVETLKNLNMLCVRLVFCLYAEDAGIFGTHEMFGQYLKRFPVEEVHRKLRELFRILNMTQEQRDDYDEYLDKELAAFPYVNGGLFADDIKIPPFTQEIVDLLIDKASAGFDWSEISPTIFGAVFESTLNPETRRSGGMHYTSIENIHKVIDPLFLDGLKAELKDIIENTKQFKTKKDKLLAFTDKLAGLVFFDPACGSGNFLTETYTSIRKLENKALSEILGDEIMFADTSDYSTIKVSIDQFYGIEINDFAVTVAKTALWIAEAQMLHETEEILNKQIEFLPLKTNANITEGNALRVDWEDVVPKDKLNYIMGNPPFVGNSGRNTADDSDNSSNMSPEQKEDKINILGKNGGVLDYVACWYVKAAHYIRNTSIRVAFVSTNSICQGEQVAPLWNTLYKDNVHIDFAYRSFRWDSEANLKAHVHCVIIGFSIAENKAPKKLFDGETKKTVTNINAYLIEAPNITIDTRKLPLNDVPVVTKGFQPTDHGYLILNDSEKAEMIKSDPETAKWIKQFITAKEYIHGKTRWCLWLVGITPNQLSKMKAIQKRVSDCKVWRESQTKTGDAYKLKDIPYLMRPNNKFKEGVFIVLPLHSGETRRYIPFGFADSSCIPGNSVSIVPDATLYHFGVLTSNVHMAWMRVVAGRIKSDYRYSSEVVYNNFPWCTPNDKQKALIEHTAQMILDARAKYPDSSLAQLYDETNMPAELRKAHQANDKAVMQAYGFDYKTMTESECVAELMKMYQKLTEGTNK